MKFSLRLNNDHVVNDYMKWALLAESVGFDQFWVSNDLFIRSAPIILSAVAAATRRIEIGTCILNPYTIHPAEIAMMAFTLDELSGGRFNLGLSSGAGDFLGWIGIEQTKPRTAVIETVEFLNHLFSGGSLSHTGTFLRWSQEAYLRIKPARRIPIYLGAMSPLMVKEIGRIADGGLPLLFPPEHIQSIIPQVRSGAEETGRRFDEIDLAACIWCSISTDRAAARDALKEKIAYYGHAMSETILSQLGLRHSDFAEIEQAVMHNHDLKRAISLVTEPMMQIGIAGDAHDLILRIESLIHMGATHISFGPPLGPDITTAIETLGREVLPYFHD